MGHAVCQKDSSKVFFKKRNFGIHLEIFVSRNVHLCDKRFGWQKLLGVNADGEGSEIEKIISTTFTMNKLYL